MNKQEFLTHFETLLEEDAETIASDKSLAELDAWDSLAVISFIAFIDERFEITLSPEKIYQAKTVSDLIVLLGDNITD